MSQQSIFDVFGSKIPEGLKVPEKKEEKEKKIKKENKKNSTEEDKSSKKSSSNSSNKLEGIVIETFPITVAYAREQEVFSREDFDKEGDVSLEDLRKKLMLDYPEFSNAKNVKMDYDKSKNLVIPAITGGKLG